MLDVTHLDALIDRSGLADSAIERMAGLSNSYLYRMRQGSFPVTRRTLTRVRLAISRLRRGETNPNEVMPSGSYRLAIAYVAMMLAMKPEDILAADPARRATADAVWMKAANGRRLALYIANQYLNVPQAELARAARLTKSAVSQAMNAIEDERGDRELELLLAAVEGAFS